MKEYNKFNNDMIRKLIIEQGPKVYNIMGTQKVKVELWISGKDKNDMKIPSNVSARNVRSNIVVDVPGSFYANCIGMNLNDQDNANVNKFISILYRRE